MMNKRWRNSLRTKIIAWTFVPIAIILSAVAWFTFYSYQRVLGDLAIKQDWAVVHAKADQAHEPFAALINSHLRPIIFEYDTDPSLAPADRAQKILEHAPDLEIFDGGIYFADQQGRVFRTHPEQPELIGQDWSDSAQFRFVRDNPPGSAPVTNIFQIRPEDAGVVCVLWPMHGLEGQFLAAGYYCLSIDPGGPSVLYGLFDSLPLGQNIRILDGSQRVIYAADPAEVGRDLSGEPSLQALLETEGMSVRYRTGSEDTLISYDPLAIVADDRNRWVVVSEQSWSEVMQPTLPYRQLLLVLLGLGVAVPTLVTAYGVRQVTDPIQKLIRASQGVTAGDFKQRIQVKTGDEIETLADQFNLMSAKLDESYSSLENRVADRTRELAILNSIISVASQSLNIQEILEDAFCKTIELMDIEAGVAFKLGPQPSLISHHNFEPALAADLVGIYLTAAQGFPEGVTAFEMGDFQDQRLIDQLQRLGYASYLYLPLAAKGRQLGFFILAKREPGQLSPEESTLLSSIGKQVGGAMENARLYEGAEQSAIAAERGRLARELHDAVTQTLFSANLIADVIPRIWEQDPQEGLKNLEELRQLTRGALAEMRTLLLEMRPESLERTGLKSLLTQLVDAFVGRVRVPVSLKIEGDGELRNEVKIAFYRIAQEALNNAAKHAGARQVDVSLDCQPGQTKLRIQDDGLGFALDAISSEHLGIAIMRERAGSIGAVLKIESQVGQGTTVELDWNVPRKD